ncbi:MAG: hypothetical protein OCD02_14230 [Spirochaetaceae bacterium]
MINKVLPYLPLFLPIIIVPIIMRLIIAPIILFRLKSKYVKELTSTIKEGWIDDRDLEAVEFLKTNAWKGLNSPFLMSFNIKFLENQIKLLFINITQIYNDDSTGKIDLKFSIQKVLEATYLIFDDIHADLKKLKVFRILEKLPINLFLRITKLNRSIKVITQNRIVQILQKYRITTKIFRLILTPILGLPIIISQLIFSLLYSTLFEGYLRFIYGLILIKVGYYTIYLYSDRNSSLHNRLEFSHKDIIEKGGIAQDRHTKFKNRFNFTTYLESALKAFKDELKKENILHSREAQQDNDTLQRLITRVTNTIKNTVDSELNFDSKNSLNLKPLIGISETIGRVYFPKSEQPLFNLRVKEAIELGYFLTTILLKNIYTIPASKDLLDKIPLKLVIDINDFLGTSGIKEYIPHIKTGSKIAKNIQGYFWATQFIIKKSHPLIFVVSLVTPILFQQVQDSLKEYIYNSVGLLLIDSYESTILKCKTCRISSIEQSLY